MRAGKPVPPSLPPIGFGAQVPLLSGPLHLESGFTTAAPGLPLKGPTLCLGLRTAGFSAGLREDLALPRGFLLLCVKKLGKPDGFRF